MNIPRPIPVLLDKVEATLFPASHLITMRRRKHWRQCDFALHYRARASDVGVLRVAKQMRRQGFGLDITLSVLARMEKRK
jgi:hypothetical protein